VIVIILHAALVVIFPAIIFHFATFKILSLDTLPLKTSVYFRQCIQNAMSALDLFVHVMMYMDHRFRKLSQLDKILIR
jgi:hypothetical protein